MAMNSSIYHPVPVIVNSGTFIGTETCCCDNNLSSGCMDVLLWEFMVAPGKMKFNQANLRERNYGKIKRYPFEVIVKEPG